ncbi:MAG: MerR family transcriptional regulator, partial [Candidatus Kerfeldbacteria bacterium]|nr:MerR family transcriptional regulator [Candidatus Kerfeldbacteria bacterium]
MLWGHVRRLNPEPGWSTLPQLLTLRSTAKLLGVHPNTLRLWDQRGILRAVRLGSRQDRRYERQQVQTLWLVRNPVRPMTASVFDAARQSRIWRQGWPRPVLAATALVATIIVLSVGQFAQAGQPGDIALLLRPEQCQGWNGADRARTIDLSSGSATRQFTKNNSATFESARSKVTSGQGAGVVVGSIDQPQMTLLCQGFSTNGIPTGAKLNAPRLELSWWSSVDGNSTDSFTIEYSLDSATWSTLKILPASSP